MIKKLFKSLTVSGLFTLLFLSQIHSIPPEVQLDIDAALNQVNAAFDTVDLLKDVDSFAAKPELSGADFVKQIVGLVKLKSNVPGITSTLIKLKLMSLAYPEIAQDRRFKRFDLILANTSFERFPQAIRWRLSPSAKYKEFAKEALSAKPAELDGKTVAEWLKDTVIEDKSTSSDDYLLYEFAQKAVEQLASEFYGDTSTTLYKDINGMFKYGTEYAKKQSPLILASGYKYFELRDSFAGYFERAQSGDETNAEYCCTEIDKLIAAYYDNWSTASEAFKPYFEQVYINAKKYVVLVKRLFEQKPELQVHVKAAKEKSIEQYGMPLVHYSDNELIRKARLDRAETLKDLLYKSGETVLPKIKDAIIDSMKSKSLKNLEHDLGFI